MNRILEKIKFLMYIPVLLSLLVGLVALGVGVWKASQLVGLLVSSGPTELTPLLFLRIMDSLVISTVLILFSTGLHVLFIGELRLPDAYQANSLHDLESKIGNLVILVMALYMLERFLESPTDTANLPLAAAVFLVAAAIIGFTTFRPRNAPLPKKSSESD